VFAFYGHAPTLARKQRRFKRGTGVYPDLLFSGQAFGRLFNDFENLLDNHWDAELHCRGTVQ